MSKFCGIIGYGIPNEIEPGLWQDEIVTRRYYGDVIRNIRRHEMGLSVNDDITVNNSISIVADAYANEHFFYMKYVEWMGVKWEIKTVEVQRPRLILTLGGVYNGETMARSAEDTGSDSGIA